MLTDNQARGLKPKEKRYSITDGEGLSLDVLPSGKKTWVISYRVNGKQNRKQLGEYPDVGCRDARIEARRFKAEIKGKNLESPSVKDVMEEWLHLMQPKWSSEKYVYTVKYRLAYITEDISHKPIDEVERKDVVKKVKEIVKKGTLETAKRALRLLSELFNFAIASDYTQKNPCALVSDVIPQQQAQNLPALSASEMPEFWHRINGYSSGYVLAAMQLACYTAVRITELLSARWDTNEIDFKNKQWIIPANRMKMRRDHVVPLVPQTLAIFKDLHENRLNDGFIFPHRLKHNEHMRSESILAVIKRNGYGGRMVTHGFRSLFSTHANESNLFRYDVIEYQIAHVPLNRIRKIYNRAEYYDERVQLMTWYANEVDKWMND